MIKRYDKKISVEEQQVARATESKVYVTILGGGRQTRCIRELKNNKYLRL